MAELRHLAQQNQKLREHVLLFTGKLDRFIEKTMMLREEQRQRLNSWKEEEKNEILTQKKKELESIEKRIRDCKKQSKTVREWIESERVLHDKVVEAENKLQEQVLFLEKATDENKQLKRIYDEQSKILDVDKAAKTKEDQVARLRDEIWHAQQRLKKLKELYHK